MEKITIIVEENGSVNYSVDGIKGQDCYESTKVLDAEFNGKDTQTQDFYEVGFSKKISQKVGR